ncbi:MAG TPA: hypothetical protein VHL59_18755, partial [Thermoanaerobaculia bacterium]|nr:hypothetical protein [Thermoanaerobaculia bacterium]
SRRGDSRSRGEWRDSSRSRSDRGRSFDRNRSHDRGRSHGHRERYHARGRVSHVRPYRGGYHVWIGGAPYPFFIPSAHYHRHRFRIGVVIGLGGYYNPLGYYDYYDQPYSYSTSARGEMSGTVESVDYRRSTFVMRNDATGSFVTIHSRDRNVDVRPGDYVEVRGNWRRSGLFEAYDVDLLD